MAPNIKLEPAREEEIIRHYTSSESSEEEESRKLLSEKTPSPFSGQDLRKDAESIKSLFLPKHPYESEPRSDQHFERHLPEPQEPNKALLELIENEPTQHSAKRYPSGYATSVGPPGTNNESSVDEYTDYDSFDPKLALYRLIIGASRHFPDLFSRSREEVAVGGKGTPQQTRRGKELSHPEALSSKRQPMWSQSGVLHIPGHEPDSPANLVLEHHERNLDELQGTLLDGISVQNDSTNITAQGATAIILGGCCFILLVFICFLMFFKRLKRERIERKMAGNEPTVNCGLPSDITTSPGLHSLTFLHPHSNVVDISSFLTIDNGRKVPGTVWFSVHYGESDQMLRLHLLHVRYRQGKNLLNNPGSLWVEMHIFTSTDSSVKASSKTSERRASLSTIFDQRYSYEIRNEDIMDCLLRMMLYDRCPTKGERAVGSVLVPLHSVDLSSTKIISRDFT